MAVSKLATRLYPVKEDFLSEEELKETERVLRNLKCSQSGTASHVKAWVEQREKSIDAIGLLEKKFENLHRACSNAHAVGSAMQAAGALAMVAGTILTACGHKTVGEFLTKRASTVTAVTGVATTMSSSVAEIGLTHMTMKDVKMVLRKDEEYSKMFMKNLKHSKAIDSYLRRIFNCSVLSNSFLLVVLLVRKGISLLEVGYAAYSELIDELKRKVSKGTGISALTETVVQNVCSTMKKISNDPKARRAVSNICDIIQQSPSSVEFIKFGLRITFQICDVLKVDIITSVLGFGILKTSAGVAATKYLLGAVLIAINVLSVISAVQSTKEGTSEYSEMLKELKLALAVELKTIRKSYSKLL